MGLKIKNPFIKGNIKDFVTGKSGGRIGSGMRIVHRLTGTKEEKQKQLRRLGGALAGAGGGFIQGGPWGAVVGGIMGAQSDDPLTLQRGLTEGAKGYLGGSVTNKIGSTIANKAGESALGAGRSYMTSSGGVGAANQGGSVLGGGSKLSLLKNLIRRNSATEQSQDDGVEEYNNQLLTDALRRMRQTRERKYLSGGNNGKNRS